MEVYKFNPKTKRYRPYRIPDKWHCPLKSEDMGEIVNCASCGKKIVYGSGYSSAEIREEDGNRYTVCTKCHTEELKRFERYSK